MHPTYYLNARVKGKIHAARLIMQPVQTRQMSCHAGTYVPDCISTGYQPLVADKTLSCQLRIFILTFFIPRIREAYYHE
ncbi:hypothetical protein [Xenorhabdus stockiae]|uniref:hypothetical protein n=1 Tax=Xenorhabdus stockiae TaxID=351614 RepID=UPI0040649A58